MNTKQVQILAGIQDCEVGKEKIVKLLNNRISVFYGSLIPSVYNKTLNIF